MSNQQSFSAQQKAQAALDAARGIRTVEEIAREYGVNPGQVRQWKRELIQKAACLFGEDGAPDHDAVRHSVSFDAAFPASPNPYLLLSPDLTIVGANDPYLQTSMKSIEEMVGRHIFDVFPHDLRDQDGAGMLAGKAMHERLETRITELTSKQRQINEALVFKIFECERTEEALQQSKTSLHQLLAHQELIKEEERKRIAREIHDDLGQNLLALRIDISMLHARTAHGHPLLHERVSVVLENLDATIKSVRSIINGLRPFELELGLQAAVEWQLKEFGRICGIPCQLSIDKTAFAEALGDEQTLAVFRILQESLNNIARHSHATKVEVTLSRNARAFSMTVKDNGVGMYLNDRRKANSFGIVGIKERVSSLGGEMTIDSKGGHGTVLSISIPVENGE